MSSCLLLKIFMHTTWSAVVFGYTIVSYFSTYNVANRNWLLLCLLMIMRPPDEATDL